MSSLNIQFPALTEGQKTGAFDGQKLRIKLAKTGQVRGAFNKLPDFFCTGI